MSETECEIEYLDEDADLVQHCVNTAPLVPVELSVKSPLLVARPRRSRRRKTKVKVEEEDSDYDPEDDIALAVANKQSKPKRKKPQPQIVRKNQPKDKKPAVNPKPNNDPIPLTVKKVISDKTLSTKNDLQYRRKFGIKIPDYEDPLCLPARALKRDEDDNYKLKTWNNLCLDHLKHCGKMLAPDKGETVYSKRTVVLRNIKNKQTERIETTIWGKTMADNCKRDRKSEVFQCILPKFRERKSLPQFNLIPNTKNRPIRKGTKNVVVLTKEDHKDGDVLVAYKPKEALTAVYKFIKSENNIENIPNNTESNNKFDEVTRIDEEPKRRCLKEVVCCKICAPCYQSSWRGFKKTENSSPPIRCPLCLGTFVSIYNLLAHVRSHHTPAEVHERSKDLSRVISESVEYHYKCRVCQLKCDSIKQLRAHLKEHEGDTLFKCEIGNHMAR